MAGAGFSKAKTTGGTVKISVIIPALNEAESIGSVVRAVPVGRPWGEIAECIVVDNGSTDATAEIARAAGAKVIASPRGYGAAMSAGDCFSAWIWRGDEGGCECGGG